MTIFIASEFRCHIYNNEHYLSSKAYSIYKRYANSFGKIILCSRFICLNEMNEDLYKVDFIEDVVTINSLKEVFLGKHDKEISNKIKRCHLVIVRLPSIIAYKAADIAVKNDKPYLAELMCDGFDPYWNHGLSGKIIAPYMHQKMKSVTFNANYAVYVTEKYLQGKYPCKNTSINASNVLIKDVDEDILVNRVKKIHDLQNNNNLSVMTTADIDLLSKGQRFVVMAMGELKKRGIKITYYLAGNGSQSHLRSVAKKYGVEEQLVFLGKLALDDVFKHLDMIDIYIQPSLQEGLPRSVIEAMSRGCPCLGARTAGIPELLDEECIFERSSGKSIADKLCNMIQTGFEQYAKNNFYHSKEYIESVLNERRNNYFDMIKCDLMGE